mmetsp:Transcript_20256/g.62416  ORF Transcript_20256/g.62416 Transcript_20256/m.62416 type:complete len:138 (+) Transcript_20256:92-505(+)
MAPPKIFMIVGEEDPVYEAELSGAPDTDETEDAISLAHFVLHAALDSVDDKIETTSDMYLKVVDKWNDQFVYAFVTGGHAKFLLLTDGKNEDAVRNFFQDVYGEYVKVVMNPFWKYDTPIISKKFDQSVRALAKRYL